MRSKIKLLLLCVLVVFIVSVPSAQQPGRILYVNKTGFHLWWTLSMLFNDTGRH